MKIHHMRGYMIKKKNSLFVFPLLLALTIGCGYKFLGTGKLPDNITRICIIMLENQTPETGFANRVTDALIAEFSRGNVSVLRDKDRADAILTGVITKMREETVARTQERQITVWVDLKLTAEDGKVVWFERGISENSLYTTTNATNTGITETREDALESLSMRIAQMAYQRLTDDF